MIKTCVAVAHAIVRTSSAAPMSVVAGTTGGIAPAISTPPVTHLNGWPIPIASRSVRQPVTREERRLAAPRSRPGRAISRS